MDDELRAAERAGDIERVRALRQRAGFTRAEDTSAIDAMAADPGCKVMPPAGLPAVELPLRLPADLARFYERCGGAEIVRGVWSWEFLPPSRVVPANPALDAERDEHDRSSTWYLLVDAGNGDHLTIDLDPERLGRCYESYFFSHAFVGESPIIARSFAELLGRLLRDVPDVGQPFWCRPDFESLGDAYD